METPGCTIHEKVASRYKNKTNRRCPRRTFTAGGIYFLPYNPRLSAIGEARVQEQHIGSAYVNASKTASKLQEEQRNAVRDIYN